MILYLSFWQQTNQILHILCKWLKVQSPNCFPFFNGHCAGPSKGLRPLRTKALISPAAGNIGGWQLMIDFCGCDCSLLKRTAWAKLTSPSWEQPTSSDWSERWGQALCPNLGWQHRDIPVSEQTRGLVVVLIMNASQSKLSLCSLLIPSFSHKSLSRGYSLPENLI